jgi:hypothetical protein
VHGDLSTVYNRKYYHHSHDHQQVNQKVPRALTCV